MPTRLSEAEYLRKREEYSVSSAPQDVIDEAIRKLDSRYSDQHTNAAKQAVEDFYESMPEYDNIAD